MDRYYYLVSSLPLLTFVEKPLINREDFISQSQKWLTLADFMSLSKADINNLIQDKNDPPILKKYKEFEYSIREELSLFRRAKREKSEYKFRKEIEEIIREESSPLEIEKSLLLLRWNFLEGEEMDHFFDVGFLIIYYLKLQLLERLFIFDKEKGKERFEIFSRVEL